MTTNNNPSFTLLVRGEHVAFTSHYPTLADAYHALEGAGDNSEFVTSLLAAARGRTLTPKQVAWIHKLASDRRPVEALNLLPIVTMLKTAAAAQKKFPRIDLRRASGGRVMLSLSKRHDGVTISDGGTWESRRWFGSIGVTGEVNRGGSWCTEVEDLLRTLAADPLAVAKQHGVATGCCCFCSRPLSTKASVAAGYGPICAEKFGLAHGATFTAQEVV